MSYQSDKLSLRSQAIASKREWVYEDTGSTLATIGAVNFFSDGKSKGMKANDTVFASIVGTAAVKRYSVVDVQGDTGTANAASIGDTG